MSKRMPTLMARAGAELIGTFFLVFLGVGAAAAGVGPVGVPLAFGAAVATMVYAVGHLSGAHFNPAVSIGFASVGRLPLQELTWYVGAQLAGATLAALALDTTVGLGVSTGVTVPTIALGGAFVIEAVLTFALMFVIISVATDPRVAPGVAGLAIGLAVTQGALAGGSFTGASMNPARSWGPSLMTGTWSVHWLYWVAPILGAVLGAATYERLRGARNSAVGATSAERTERIQG